MQYEIITIETNNSKESNDQISTSRSLAIVGAQKSPKSPNSNLSTSETSAKVSPKSKSSFSPNSPISKNAQNLSPNKA